MIGGSRFNVRGEAVERGAVGVKFGRPFLGDFGQQTFFLPSSADRLVVHVSEISDVTHLVGAEFEFEHTTDDVIDHERPEIANVRGSINGRATVVETVNPIGLGRRDGTKRARKRVVELQSHGGKGKNVNPSSLENPTLNPANASKTKHP